MKWKKLLTRAWPYLGIFLVVGIYLNYILIDSRYFFYDDFYYLSFVNQRSYSQIIWDNLHTRDIDQHKILNFLAWKWMYNSFGGQIEPYFVVIFAIHLLNAWLLYRLLHRLSGKKNSSLLISAIFAWRFSLSWITNIEDILELFFFLLSFNLWAEYLIEKKKRNLWIMLVLYLPMIYSYGAAAFLYPALVGFTLFAKGWNSGWGYVRRLIPFLIFSAVYLSVYIVNPDTEVRFATQLNPYYRPITLSTYINVQAQFLHLLSNWTPLSIWSVVGAVLLIIVLAIKVDRKLLWIAAAFGIAIFPNSFFPLHTMFYYLYTPIVFVLLFFVYLEKKIKVLAIILLLLLFNPFYNFYTVAYRLRHPAVNFEKQAMENMATAIDKTLASSGHEVQLSNWEITPNLRHAISRQTVKLWLTAKNKDDYIYSYDAKTEKLLLWDEK